MATFRFNSKKSVDGPRQGNENDVVYIYTYVTEKTFDAYLFQLVETKQKFISQIMTSRTPVRSAEDVDEKALSYAEIKALAAGNPLILEKTQLDTDVAKLKLLKQSYLSEIYRLEDMIVKYYPNRIKELEDKVLGIEKDLNLKISNYMYDQFRKLGIPVKLTRTTDETVSPTERTQRILDAFGNNNDVIVISNILISNHVNSGGGDSQSVTNV